jgi:hypothetical protein
LTFAIARAPSGSQCLVTQNVQIDVVVPEAAVGDGVTQAVMDEPCTMAGCRGMPIAIP